MPAEKKAQAQLAVAAEQEMIPHNGFSRDDCRKGRKGKTLQSGKGIA